MWEKFLAYINGERNKLDAEVVNVFEDLKARVEAIEAHLIKNNDSLPHKFAPAGAAASAPAVDSLTAAIASATAATASAIAVDSVTGGDVESDTGGNDVLAKR
jgi:predicted regulator of Ras-like GTPase activity (Roadblock/LC7/MglB family)